MHEDYGASRTDIDMHKSHAARPPRPRRKRTSAVLDAPFTGGVAASGSVPWQLHPAQRLGEEGGADSGLGEAVLCGEVLDGGEVLLVRGDVERDRVIVEPRFIGPCGNVAQTVRSA